MFVANANVLRPNSYSQSEQNDLMKCNVFRSVGQISWTVLIVLDRAQAWFSLMCSTAAF